MAGKLLMLMFCQERALSGKKLFLIDNDEDEPVLKQIDKRWKGVHAVILPRKMSQVLFVDLKNTKRSIHPSLPGKTIVTFCDWQLLK